MVNSTNGMSDSAALEDDFPVDVEAVGSLAGSLGCLLGNTKTVAAVTAKTKTPITTRRIEMCGKRFTG